MIKRLKNPIVLITLTLIVIISCILLLKQKNPPATNIISQVSTIDESEPTVPELNVLHESIALLWHTAYPQKDLNAIKNALPKLLQSTTNLAIAKLPGILQDKQVSWEKGVEEFQLKVKGLEKAVNNNDLNTALLFVESMHTEYENLSNILRPKIAELEDFHQQLYKVYHYYLPEENTQKIIEIIPIMQEKYTSLKGVTLPIKYKDKQPQFNRALLDLKKALDELEASPSSKPIVENLHTAYQTVDEIFQ